MSDWDPAKAAASILERKNDFAAYNIIRLRELLRYLPRKRAELFQLIPFLLHVNTPDFPGYVPSRQPFYGIYDFLATGFWRHVKSNWRIAPKALNAIISKKNNILGLYLMGSSGTLAQAAHSDFDYWVLVDDSPAAAEHEALLGRKLSQISRWSQDAYQQNVTFFILRHSQIRENAFSGVDEESSGSLQMTILKEEFYRTFILIAGKIPWWAVLPTGCSEREYDTLIRLAAASATVDFNADDYVDLGNLTAIDPAECPGAVLWQVYKSRKDAVKALLKSTLVAWFFFFSPETTLPCDQIKGGYAERRLDSHLLDPYALVLDTAESFYQLIDDPEGLDLIRQCIFFRLSGYPQALRTAAGPKGRLLAKYIGKWQWNAERINALTDYPAWPESQKLAFEKQLFAKISFLYEMILSGRDSQPAGPSGNPSDLAALKNRIAASFHAAAGKIPLASAFVRSRSDAAPLVLACHINEHHQFAWSVSDPALAGNPGTDGLLFTGAELLRAAGWLLLNRLGGDDLSQVAVRPNQFPASASRLARFLAEAGRFFTDKARTPEAMAEKPRWHQMLLLAEPASPLEQTPFSTVTVLSRNTWKEIYFSRLDLSNIENPTLKCYRIASFIWEFMQPPPAVSINYQVKSFRGAADREMLRWIDDFVTGFKKSTTAPPSAATGREPGMHANDEDDKPFLDLL